MNNEFHLKILVFRGLGYGGEQKEEHRIAFSRNTIEFADTNIATQKVHLM
jgi:hypothetical protein